DNTTLFSFFLLFGDGKSRELINFKFIVFGSKSVGNEAFFNMLQRSLSRYADTLAGGIIIESP
ncbi:hypothetical protein, partial [Staphylococcus epidermidis]|uniref:hypothetical protein n=1 Tax=Staphylococcus epidermidis TaxID=1282 RepID=UPI0030C48D24